MAERYYPHLPWDDVPVQSDSIDHDRVTPEWLTRDRVTSEWLTRDGIYGPYTQIFKWLSARDNKQLVADVRIIGTLQTA